MLKYNGSNPSLLKISVELDRQINLKQFCVIFTFLQTLLVSIEAEFDSNYPILHNGKADLWQGNPQCKMITYMPYLTVWDKVSQYLAHLEANSHMIFQISQNFIKSPLKICLISQISVHSLWYVCDKI